MRWGLRFRRPVKREEAPKAISRLGAGRDLTALARQQIKTGQEAASLMVCEVREPYIMVSLGGHVHQEDDSCMCFLNVSVYGVSDADLAQCWPAKADPETAQADR